MFWAPWSPGLCAKLKARCLLLRPRQQPAPLPILRCAAICMPHGLAGASRLPGTAVQKSSTALGGHQGQLVI